MKSLLGAAVLGISTAASAQPVTPYRDCKVEDEQQYYAVDANRDGIRDTLNSGDVFCSDDINLERNAIRKDFEERVKGVQGAITQRDLPRMTVGKEGDYLLAFLERNRLLGNTDAAISVTQRYLRSQMDVDYAYFMQPNYEIAISAGEILIFDGFDLIKTFYLNPETITPSAPDNLVAIPTPECNAQEWDWKRPESDAFKPSNGVFRLQSGKKVPATDELKGLSRILPSSWNIAKMPPYENGLALDIMFDGCCDGISSNKHAADVDMYNLPSDAIIIGGTRGGFMVEFPDATYAFEPGKFGHIYWDAKTKGTIDGLGSDSDDWQAPRREGKTRSTVVRRGSIDDKKPSLYWDGDDANKGNWCKNSAPASLAAIHSLVGDRPFWIIGDYFWGNFNQFEGSDALDLVGAKRTVDQSTPVYQVRFK